MTRDREERAARRGSRPRGARRGVYILPSLFTVGNIFCGYVSMVRTTFGEYETAALLILVAALLDALDGRVARATGASSEFGLQLDSIADVVSFAAAPALLVFSWSLSSFGRIGWAVSFLFVVCGALRLARFNLQKRNIDRRYFIGMPIPAAAWVLAATVYADPNPSDRFPEPFMDVMLLLLVALVSILMVSRLKYRSFKDFDMRSRRSYVYLLVPAVGLALVALHPQAMLMLGGFAYLLSGVLPRHWRARKESPADIEKPVPAGTSGGKDGA
ncbi:MAG: CDP-diacylglycerol--serine O-phosphatidyltransferase [Acidobacteriota bacterium]